MNLLDLSAAISNPSSFAWKRDGTGWVGDPESGYTTDIGGLEFKAVVRASSVVLQHDTSDGGMVRMFPNGVVEWTNADRELHREDGPARTLPSGKQEWYKNDNLHREDGPAVIDVDGSEYWFNNGELHREDGPARTHPSGIQEWYKNGHLHREDGPAIISTDGSEYWYQHGALHREDGPAKSWLGNAYWYRHGKLHREDGPAIMRAAGTVEYWLHGKQVNEEDLS